VTLSLCDNELQLLPPQIGNLKKLRRLLLANNCFADVPEVIRFGISAYISSEPPLQHSSSS
jgi:hypothetical protein